MQGVTTAVYLLPKTETAIITLQNSTRLGDACDWISQLILHTLSREEGQDIDFEKLATTARETSTTLASKIESTLEEKHEKNTKPLELKAYVGRY